MLIMVGIVIKNKKIKFIKFTEIIKFIKISRLIEAVLRIAYSEPKV